MRVATAAIVALSVLLELPSAAADICSFRGGRVYRFSRMTHPNGTEITAKEFMATAGPMWAGHVADCPAETAKVPETLEISSAFTGSKNFIATVAVAKKLLSERTKAARAAIIAAEGVSSSSSPYRGSAALFARQAHEIDEIPGAQTALESATDTPPQPDAVQVLANKCKDALEQIAKDYNNRPPGSNVPPRQTAPTPIDPGQPGGRPHLQRRAAPDSPNPFDRCLPLTSSDPMGNPYHEMLTGMPDSATRHGRGFPIFIQEVPMCPASKDPDAHITCDFTVTKTRTIEVNVGFSISTGGSATVSKLAGTSWGKSSEDSNAKTVGQAMDQTWQNTTTMDEHTSKSKDVAKMQGKSYEKQKAKTITKTTTEEETNTNSRMDGKTTEDTWNTDTYDLTTESNGGSDTYTSDEERSQAKTQSLDRIQSCTDEQGINHALSVDVQGVWKVFSLGVSGSKGDDKRASSTSTAQIGDAVTDTATTRNGRQRATTWDTAKQSGTVRSKGGRKATSWEITKSKAIMKGRSSAEANEERTSDGISESLTTTEVEGKEWGKSRADMRGGTTSTNQGETQTLVFSNSTGGEASVTNSTTEDFNRGSSNSTTESSTLGYASTLKYDAGTCKRYVCLPKVISIVTPWLCKNPDKPREMDVVTTEIQNMLPNEDGTGIDCLPSLVDCDDSDSFRVVEHDRIPTGDATNVLKGGKIFQSINNDILVSQNRDYTLSFQASGNSACTVSALVVKNYDRVVWSTGVEGLGCLRPGDDKRALTRLIITVDGKLVQQAQNILISEYPSDDWLPVWTSVPKHLLTYGVGVSGDVGYSLVLRDNGILDLFDGVGSKVWTSGRESHHNLGYKYPIDTVVPTYFKTESSEGDVRLELPQDITWKSNSLAEYDSDCEKNVIYGGEGLRSSAGNVTFHLEKTGNAVFKQNGRTLWETNTANMPYVDAGATYRMTLGRTGTLYIRDNQNRVLWNTLDRRVNATYQGPYTLAVTDFGRLDIYGSDPRPIWVSWPSTPGSKGGDSNTFMISSAPDLMCDKCSPCVDPQTLPRKPFVNLATSNCTGPTGVDADCKSDHKQWVYDPAWKYYRNWKFPNLCIGGLNETVTNCTSSTAPYVHYKDGFLRLTNFPNVCVGKDGKWSPCTGSIFQKRWGHGHRTMPKLETGGVRVLLSGERIVNGTTSFGIRPNGTLFTEGVATPKSWGPSNVGKLGKYYYLEILRDGNLVIKNMDDLQIYQWDTGFKPFKGVDGKLDSADSPSPKNPTILPRTLTITANGAVQLKNGRGTVMKAIL
ncbi:hypothetical protein HDU86_005201 [Geranomyces michiganensis]|nr:hypothetical protein HDU86_005201 [Geranomyces michiganensis]